VRRKYERVPVRTAITRRGKSLSYARKLVTA
jgi:hypothetical protein